MNSHGQDSLGTLRNTGEIWLPTTKYKIILTLIGDQKIARVAI